MGKLFDLINKDTKHKNESKRMTVIIRQMVLIFMCVSLFNLILDAFFIKSVPGSILWAVMLVVDGITFYISYNAPKLIILTIFVFQKALWITAAVVLFGWEGGFQFFLILLVIMYSFGEAGYNRKKVLLDFCLFAMFIVFLIFFKGNPGKISIDHVDRSIQVVNALAFVIMVSIISFSFSKESQHMEDKLISYNNQLRKQASVDALTGLYNRRSTMEIVNDIVLQRRVMSICIGDIDFFKKINDSYGHDFGDTVLVAISEALKKETEEYGFVARWGGEEFLIVFADLNGDDAYIKLSHIRDTVKELKLNHGKEEVRVKMTYGLTEYDYSKSFEDNIKEADEKLYLGKQNGRDMIVY